MRAGCVVAAPNAATTVVAVFGGEVSRVGQIREHDDMRSLCNDRHDLAEHAFRRDIAFSPPEDEYASRFADQLGVVELQNVSAQHRKRLEPLRPDDRTNSIPLCRIPNRRAANADDAATSAQPLGGFSECTRGMT